MLKNLTFLMTALLALAAVSGAWELTPKLTYGYSLLYGAPCAYVETEPARETNEPLGGALGADFGRYSVEVSYLPRYDLYAVIGPVHDFAAVGRAAVIDRERWAIYGEGGVGFAKCAAPMAFLYEEGPEYEWTAVVGAGVTCRPSEWLDVDAGVTFRKRLQVVNFFEYDPRYGTVKSPAVDVYAECLFAPVRYVAFGPSFRQILYGPYDYYLYAETHRNAGWVTGKETYILATVAVPLEF